MGGGEVALFLLRGERENVNEVPGRAVKEGLERAANKWKV